MKPYYVKPSEETMSNMRTALPTEITTKQEAMEFIASLVSNSEHYHPDDNAHDIYWGWVYEIPKYEECTQLNKLMNQCHELLDDIYGWLMWLERKNPKSWHTTFFNSELQNLVISGVFEYGKQYTYMTQYAFTVDADYCYELAIADNDTGKFIATLDYDRERDRDSDIELLNWLGIDIEALSY